MACWVTVLRCSCLYMEDLPFEHVSVRRPPRIQRRLRVTSNRGLYRGQDNFDRTNKLGIDGDNLLRPAVTWRAAGAVADRAARGVDFGGNVVDGHPLVLEVLAFLLVFFAFALLTQSL